MDKFDINTCGLSECREVLRETRRQLSGESRTLREVRVQAEKVERALRDITRERDKYRSRCNYLMNQISSMTGRAVMFSEG